MDEGGSATLCWLPKGTNPSPGSRTGPREPGSNDGRSPTSTFSFLLLPCGAGGKNKNLWARSVQAWVVGVVCAGDCLTFPRLRLAGRGPAYAAAVAGRCGSNCRSQPVRRRASTREPEPNSPRRSGAREAARGTDGDSQWGNNWVMTGGDSGQKVLAHCLGSARSPSRCSLRVSPASAAWRKRDGKRGSWEGAEQRASHRRGAPERLLAVRSRRRRSSAGRLEGRA